jgi:hypothetical protein
MVPLTILSPLACRAYRENGAVCEDGEQKRLSAEIPVKLGYRQERQKRYFLIILPFMQHSICHLLGFLALLCHKTWRNWPAKRCQQIGFFHKMMWHFASSIQTLPGVLKWASFLAIHGA